MSVKTKNEGKCFVCGQRIAYMAATRHVESCLKEKSPPINLLDENKLYLIKVAHGSDFWMYLEVDCKALLSHIDVILRQKWVECCGHTSTFNIRSQTYYSDPPEEGDASMGCSVGPLLKRGMRFMYEYDAGDATELALTVIGTREGGMDTPVRRVARNYMPKYLCEDCDALSDAVCVTCGDMMCEDCAEDHACGTDNLLCIVNSPRSGTCTYEGAADDDWELEDESEGETTHNNSI